jgi:beta-galactosidase
VSWTLSNPDQVNITSGQLATGLKASNGTRYGSDNFFTGGTGRKVLQRTRRSEGDATPIRGVESPADAELYATYREGRFRYEIPLSDGNYRLSLGFVEPSKGMAAGGRVFDVSVNGTKAISSLDVVREAGAYRTVLTRTLPVTVSNGRLELVFTPLTGDAIVSNIAISRQ